jgi:hypothetical protein
MVLLPFVKSPLQKALQRFLRGEDLEEALKPVDEKTIASKRDAQAVVEALRRVSRVPSRPADRYRTSPLHHLAAMFQSVTDRDAAELLTREGAPELLRIARASFPPREDDHDDLAFLLKILVMDRVPEATELVVEAASLPATRDMFLWSVIFQQLEGDHPLADEIVARLRDPLPEGFAGVAFLDLANARARAGRREAHPFDTATGLARIEAWLRDEDPEHYSYALSATAAIPFLRTPTRQHLLELARTHRDLPIRLEGHWAAARLGDESGVAALADAARDPRLGARPLTYLEELGRLDAAPAETQTDEHLAMVEMADWLSYPTEFGAFPDAMRIYDTRELFWPPTNDRRRLWLIEYTYEKSAERSEEAVGIGLVGSITFALFGSVERNASPEDVYGLHCAWELQTNDDPRAPKTLSAEAGRALLGI